MEYIINQPAEEAAGQLIENLGLSLSDPNIVDTPRRLVKALTEIIHGNTSDAATLIDDCLQTTFPTEYSGPIIIAPIDCVSLCSHHLLPVNYRVYFGYIPRTQSLGFSKISKVIKTLAAKPTLQEDFTQQVANVFYDSIDPLGLALIVQGLHGCMTLRGDYSASVNTTTIFRGQYQQPSYRSEFINLITNCHGRD